MNNTTEFGKFMRKIRIEKNLILKDVAELLGVSSAFLSAVEVGKKSIPTKWVDDLPRVLNLNDAEKTRLQKAINSSKHTITITEKDNVSVEMLALLARKCEGISKEDIKKILNRKD